MFLNPLFNFYLFTYLLFCSQFRKDNYKHNSTHRTDFRNFGTAAPDTILRRKGELRNHGLPPELVFHHHSNKYANNMVSWYDEDYNGRWREKVLPKTRSWNSHLLAWVPEKNDNPIQGDWQCDFLFQILETYPWSSEVRVPLPDWRNAFTCVQAGKQTRAQITDGFKWTSVHESMCVCVCVWGGGKYVCVCTCMHMCVHMCVCVCVCVCVWACMCVLSQTRKLCVCLDQKWILKTSWQTHWLTETVTETEKITKQTTKTQKKKQKQK